MREHAVTFFIRYKDKQIAFRRIQQVPRVGDVCVFHEKRYLVERVEWCLDSDATDIGTKVNIELTDTEGRKDV